MDKKNYKNHIDERTTGVTLMKVCLACWYESLGHELEECPRCRGKMHIWNQPKKKE